MILLNIKFILAKILCRILKIDILRITEPPIPEKPIPTLVTSYLNI